jgi:hypothetical protein
MFVMVKWKMKTVAVIGGQARPREAGDEDLLDKIEAKRLAISGICEIIGTPEAVMNSRKIEGDKVEVEVIDDPEPDADGRTDGTSVPPDTAPGEVAEAEDEVEGGS